jgi:hypothetical protein
MCCDFLREQSVNNAGAQEFRRTFSCKEKAGEESPAL